MRQAKTDLCSQEAHKIDIQRLPLHVLGSHVDDAGQPKFGAHCCLHTMQHNLFSFRAQLQDRVLSVQLSCTDCDQPQ